MATRSTGLKKVVQFVLRSDLRATHSCSVCGCLVAIEDQQRHRDYHSTNDK